MDLFHHQALLREEEDGIWVCSRCGLVNPPEDEPCTPLALKPSDQDREAA